MKINLLSRVVTRYILVILCWAACCCAFAQDAQAPPYLNPSKPIEERIADLISRMTLEEKAAELNHYAVEIPRLQIPSWSGQNQTLHGVWSKQPTTLFPTAIAMGATWDPGLIHSIADAMSDEARALYNIGGYGARYKAGLVYRSPVINISRNPLWGRIQETFSEDPFLTSRIAVAYIKGLQGDDPRYLKVASTVKHFAVNNVETNRHNLSATVDERNLMEYWLPHWKAAIVEGHAQSVMASYNAVNGVPNTVNKYLLTDVLRGMWGFDGFVTDDSDGVSALVTGHEISDPVEATARALQAGCDSDDAPFQTNIPIGVRSGRIQMADVDQALTRVLRVAFRLGVFDPPAMNPYSTIPASVIRSPEHLQLSLQAALESMTLLSNHSNILPLQKSTLKSVAVIGPAGGSDYETGNYYGKPARKISALQGIQNLLGADVAVRYERGASYTEAADPAAIARAVDLASKSDVAIVFLGTNLMVEAEGRDRTNLDLPGAQEQLLERVYAANPKTILVLETAGPLAVTWANGHVPAILQSWYPGEAAGTAIAMVLFGAYNPGGHLPYTVYASLDDIPPQDEYDVSKGYTYLYFRGTPLYPFGHGLSYTQFKYDKLRLSRREMGDKSDVDISFDLTNTGSRTGSATPQLYVHQVKSNVVQPIKSLRWFQRIILKPGERRHFSLTLRASQLSYYDVVTKQFVVDPGMFDIMLGESSADIRLRAQVRVTKSTM